MAVKTLCLTGWQQPSDALASIAPDATHFDYSAFRNARDMFAALPDADIAIGWSLGGQLLMRAVAGGYIKPQLLILLAAPYQCVADEQFQWGMPPDMLQAFRSGYRKQPEKTLEEFCALMGLGDSDAISITRELQDAIVMWNGGLYWLDELAKFSCKTLDFAGFPPTVIFHGQEDKVIDAASAQELARLIDGARLLVIPECGHVPHLHSARALRDLIGNYV